MGLKQLIASVLLVFVAGSLGYLLIAENGTPPVDQPAQLQPLPPQALEPIPAGIDAVAPLSKPERRLVAYYFHGNARCPTCLAIEDFSKEALTSSFSLEIASGTLEWQSVNTDEVWNSHYWKDFDLSFSSLVIADVSGDATLRYKNLQKVWELVHEKEAFFEYVRSETLGFLEAL